MTERQRVPPLLIAVAAALLALRKPWALHTPQLWAEDGSIFLVQDEQLGLRALWQPYNGYLHLLLRMIAWIASHTVDVAWYPAIYNGLAFAVTVALFARLASPRVALPHKAWLMLALVLVAHTGEVLINVTNLQWLTALFLVLHLFTRPPENGRQRLGDFAVLAIVGLNGPFALLFLPLFAWRAVRDRNADTWLALGVVAACAAVQGVLVSRGGLGIDDANAGFRPGMFLSVLGSRLITWPFLGAGAVRAWPWWMHALLAVVGIGSLLAWALRRDPRRESRAMLAAAFALIAVAGVVRVRADLWDSDTLVNGDRYFYLPRVLLAWLLILEFDSAPRVVALAARSACLIAVLTHAASFSLPPPPNYRWTEHCEPIRRGTPAVIPTLPEGWTLEYPGRARAP